MLQVKPIKTFIFRPGDDLIDFIVHSLQGQSVENRIIAVTSKIVSLAENRLISQSEIEKEALVKRESDYYIGPSAYNCHLTIKEGLIIPSAGIDESNSETGDYILYPKNPFKSAQRIALALRTRLNESKIGVLLTDSRTSPLRKGVSGVALSYYGFRGLKTMIGEEDLFGRPLKMTTINLADALGTAATLTMGEGPESCPLAIIKYPVVFEDLDNNDEIKMDPEEDLYWPVLQENYSNKIKPLGDGQTR